jgi:2-oxo-4-hydroxy-4-carboxy-5-ureidoimidazoline decarboxylase
VDRPGEVLTAEWACLGPPGGVDLWSTEELMDTSHDTVGLRSVEWLNELPEADAAVELRACCAAPAWVETMLAARPYPSVDALLDISTAAIAGFDDTALDQALAAHARIGERRDGVSREDAWSRTEQAGALGAGQDLAAALEAGNRAYEARFGRVFLIRAAGRSGEEMLAALRARLGNDDATERAVVLRELAEIVALRLTGLVTA